MVEYKKAELINLIEDAKKNDRVDYLKSLAKKEVKGKNGKEKYHSLNCAASTTLNSMKIYFQRVLKRKKHSGKQLKTFKNKRPQSEICGLLSYMWESMKYNLYKVV